MQREFIHGKKFNEQWQSLGLTDDNLKDMSKAYELISASLNEIISDLEENDGKNLRREVVEVEKIAPQTVSPQNKARYQATQENNLQLGNGALV